MYCYMNIRNQSCPNPNCTFYGKVIAGNIVIHSCKYRRFQCKFCKKTWHEDIGSCYYCLRKNEEVFERCVSYLKEGMSIRRIAEMLHVSPSTVVRWKQKISIS